MSEDGGNAMLYALMLLLPLSALFARRLPIGSVVKMALSWIAIFLVMIVAVGQRDRLAPAWYATRDAMFGQDRTVHGGIVRLRIQPDGHFWADVSINGVARRMLVDSGATTTALSTATAKAAGIDITGGAFPRMIDTANGSVLARTATVDRLVIGAIEARGLPVVVADVFGENDVLGMNFLKKLKAWRVERGVLILKPTTSM